MIMVRTLRRDIARYNAGEGDSLAGLDESIEETGWKLVHGDVFRPPTNSRLFAAVIGSGIQIFFMTLITICKNIYYFSINKLLPEFIILLINKLIKFYTFKIFEFTLEIKIKYIQILNFKICNKKE